MVFVLCNYYQEGSSTNMPAFNYSAGESGYKLFPGKDGKFKIEFYKSGTLTFSSVNTASKSKLVLVGGGQSGKLGRAGSDSAGQAIGGDGGNGGEVTQTPFLTWMDGVSYQITIGDANQDTYVKNGNAELGRARGGENSKTGLGGRGADGNSAKAPQQGGPGEFILGAYYGAGGGGGGMGGVNGSGGYGGADGIHGSGTGGSGTTDNGGKGIRNTGAGGGGGYAFWATQGVEPLTQGGKGGSGIVILHNY